MAVVEKIFAKNYLFMAILCATLDFLAWQLLPDFAAPTPFLQYHITKIIGF